jgi:hypothetical protein
MRHFPFTAPGAIALLVLSGLSFISCSGDDNPVDTSTLSAPTNFRAYSATHTSVGLAWTLSSTESAAEFAGYALRATAPGGAQVAYELLNPGAAAFTVTGLTEGTVYTFVLHSRNTDGALSSDSVSVQWAPARRLLTEGTVPIQVYEFASLSGKSGLQFYSSVTQGPQTHSLLASNTTRILADVYVTTNQDQTMSIASMNLSGIGGAKTTQFSTFTRQSSTLDDPQQAPPTSATYTSSAFVIPSGNASTGLVVYARSVTENKYVRILVQRNAANGTLYYGTSPDRYLTLVLSYQDIAGVIYAKPAAGGDRP